MSWQKYFGNIGLINLKKRPDRLEQSSKILDEFGVAYKIIEAVENNDRPCEGLVVTMQKYFRQLIDNGVERCLLFEDDILNLIDTETFKDTMNNIVEQIPQDWDMIYLGCNPAGGMAKFYSNNLIPIPFAYATHAAAYSKRTMQFLVEREIHEPIDNFMVREFHPYCKCFVSYPLLFTQRPNYSDIGKAHTDWSLFIEHRYNEQVIRLITDRNNAARR